MLTVDSEASDRETTDKQEVAIKEKHFDLPMLHPTERKARADVRKCEKLFACSPKQHFIFCSIGHSDLNSHFKKFNTSNISLTLKEPHQPKYALSTLSLHPQ